MKGMPATKVLPDAAVIRGGMDVVVSPMFAKPGLARLAYNYEFSINGGVDRVRGIEPFDGRASPSAAVFQLIQCTATVSGIAVGNTVTGASSGATGKVIYISGDTLAVTRITGTFTAEGLQVGGITHATVLDLAPPLNGFLDNRLSKLAADEYQASITAVPGSGKVRGIAVLNGNVYAWRDNAGATAMVIHKATTSGWAAVALGHQLSFTAGLAAGIVEGNTVTGATSGATGVVSRVVVESGAFSTNDAAGRLILSATTGTFSAAESLRVAGTNRATASGAATAITLAPGGASGRVETSVFSFTSTLADKRLYGCDGVNPEFEFDGTVYVPLNTGMGSIRATAVCCHKNHLFYAYRTSLQNSAIANPYVWSAVFGAAELSAGDTITNLVPIGGSEANAALMAVCQNAISVLYGNSAADPWNMVPLSTVSGGQARSAKDIGGVVAVDTPGVTRYPATKSFGNFAWDVVSLSIAPIVRSQTVTCAVFVPGLFKYRVFFSDGSAISGLPNGPGFAWSILNYGRNIVEAICEEISGVSRTFYGDDMGWVYEADVGRSFAGDAIQCAIRLHPLAQSSPMVEKTYRQMQLEITSESACTIYTQGEFSAEEGTSQLTEAQQYGAGLIWDLSNYDQSYYDAALSGRSTFPLEGSGPGVAICISGESDNELSHSIFAVTVLYTPRKILR